MNVDRVRYRRRTEEPYRARLYRAFGNRGEVIVEGVQIDDEAQIIASER